MLQQTRQMHDHYGKWITIDMSSEQKKLFKIGKRLLESVIQDLT